MSARECPLINCGRERRPLEKMIAAPVRRSGLARRPGVGSEKVVRRSNAADITAIQQVESPLRHFADSKYTGRRGGDRRARHDLARALKPIAHGRRCLGWRKDFGQRLVGGGPVQLS